MGSLQLFRFFYIAVYVSVAFNKSKLHKIDSIYISSRTTRSDLLLSRLLVLSITCSFFAILGNLGHIIAITIISSSFLLGPLALIKFIMLPIFPVLVVILMCILINTLLESNFAPFLMVIIISTATEILPLSVAKYSFMLYSNPIAILEYGSHSDCIRMILVLIITYALLLPTTIFVYNRKELI